MKRNTVLLTLLLVGVSIGAWLGTGPEARPTTRIVSNSSAGTVLDVELPGVTAVPITVDNRTYQVVNIPGDVMAALEVGKPQVPKLSYLLGIPDDAKVQVSVEVLERRTFDNIVLYPYQTPATEGSNHPFVIDEQFYAKDGSYPDFDAQVMGTGIWRELAIGNIQVFPVHYNPAKQQLTVYTRFRVNVKYSGGPYAVKRLPAWLASNYARYVDNFRHLPVTIDHGDNPGVEYLVVAHDNWWNHPWLKDSLIAWHQKRGVETRIIHKPSWTAQEIKDSIRAEYNRHTPAQLRWVLLVGEYGEIPMQPLGGVGMSDYWYSDLLPPTPDNFPEIGLSRLSPSSPQDLENQVKKILKFTKDPPTTANWLTRHELVACSEQYPGKYSGCVRGIYQHPMAWYRYDFDTLMCQFMGNDSIAARINRGRGVVTYRGHGDNNQWYTMALQGGAPWYISNVHQLTNGDLTPMIYNIACNCGAISDTTCLSEAWLRKYPGGGVGSFAATQASYTYPNHGICSTLVRSMCDTWTINIPGVRDYVLPTWDIGWIQCNVDAYVGKYWPGSPYPDNIYMYLNLGDPAMQVWSGGMPVAPTVTYLPRVPVGPYPLDVNVTVNGAPVAGARVCAWKPGEFYVVGFTNNSGNVTLNINPTTPGEFSVTASDGHAAGTPHTPMLPFEGTCLAATSGTPYVVYLRHVINDSPPGGNGDGSVNPGETIKLPLWVKNHGDSIARSLVGKLRTADGFVTVLDSVRSFGDVGARDSAFTGPNGYRFSVAQACTNGHQIRFDLQCRDALDSVWNSRLYIRVGAPFLTFVSVLALDTVQGGNRNGRLDPNETANLVVTLRNIGYGNAQNVTAVLKSGDNRMLVTDSFGSFGSIPAESTGLNGQDQFTVRTLAMAPETRIPCTLFVTSGGLNQTLPFSIMVGEIRATDPIPDGPRTPALYWAYDNVDTFYTERPDFDWVEIRNLGTRLTLSDDQTVVIDLPSSFGPFRFYNQNYTQVSICGNGWVAPGYTTVSTYTNTSLPATTIPGALCINWDDLYPPTGGGVWYYHDQANHRFIIEWDSVAYYANRSTFDKNQIILYDTTRASSDGNCEFLFQYLTANQTSSATVGEQDPTVQIAIQALYDGSYHRGSAPVVAGRAIKFTTDLPNVGVAESELGASRIPRRLALTVTPNPMRGSAAICWQVPTAGRTRLAVYDVGGRLVRTLTDGISEPGSYVTAWNGRDNSGRVVANGTYLYKLETESGCHTTKAVLLR
ncbi:MAG: C25 family cysteine peptidase [candidate division WOR-3 bacterium]